MRRVLDGCIDQDCPGGAAAPLVDRSFLEDPPHRLPPCLALGWCPAWRDPSDVCHASFLKHEQVLRVDVASFSPIVRYLTQFR
jgi:hypothetical protein